MPSRALPFVLLMSAGALLPTAAAPAEAARAASGIHRCVGADGRSIFTDRLCDEVQGTDRPPPAAAAGNVRLAPQMCSRTREDLLWGVRSALEARDVNRFAAYYLWTGMGTVEAYRLMDRLAVFSERPLVDAQLLSSADLRQDAAVEASPAAPLEQTSAEESLGIAAPPSPEAPVAPAATHAPDLLRVDQMRAGDDAASETTYFRLQPYAGCWWIRY